MLYSCGRVQCMTFLNLCFGDWVNNMLLTFLFCELIFAGYVFAMRLSKADSRIMKDSELVYSGESKGGGVWWWWGRGSSNRGLLAKAPRCFISQREAVERLRAGLPLAYRSWSSRLAPFLRSIFTGSWQPAVPLSFCVLRHCFVFLSFVLSTNNMRRCKWCSSPLRVRHWYTCPDTGNSGHFKQQVARLFTWFMWTPSAVGQNGK